MYLLAIPYGSYVVDQRSGDGWISGWSQIFALYQRNSWSRLLDAKIASALNKIIQNTRFKKKVSLEEVKAHKEDRFLRGRQIAYLIYEYFRVTGANDSVEYYADIIYSCSSKWWYSGIRFEMGRNFMSMTKIPPDDILEGLYKLRIRGSEKLKTVLEFYNMEIHQKKAGPDYHRLKTMVKRSIEQDLRIRNFEAKESWGKSEWKKEV